MSRPDNRGHRVYLVLCPEGWNPASPNSMPPSFNDVILYARNLKPWVARGAAQACNQTATGEACYGIWNRRRAIVVEHPHRRRRSGSTTQIQCSVASAGDIAEPIVT